MTDVSQLQEYAEFACAAAESAGAAILPHFRARIAVDDKGGQRGYDPVTEADRAAEVLPQLARLAGVPAPSLEMVAALIDLLTHPAAARG